MSDTETKLEALSAAEAEGQPSGNLYQEELRRYRMALNRGIDRAYRRYGFVLYHSLEGAEAVELRQKIGLPMEDALDAYNLGVVAAQKDEWAEAVRCFQQALAADSALADAEYNLALALEKKGDAAGARKRWNSYLKREDLSEADRGAVEAHVKEL
ncbi:MAG: tetratricopeptide repeat protein [Candidatus Sumerlaeota bacterium]|nr:tetratricopeptide repeat protein [Candidatus Sumerlaeota bacterium]